MPRSVRKSLLGVALIIALALNLRGQTDDPNSALTLSSRLDFQVFQRSTGACGNINISGFSPEGSHLKVLLKGSAVGGPIYPPWKRIKSFDVEFPSPSGKFYSLTVRAHQRHRPVMMVTVPHVGIGEVFIIAGRSNSTNFGEVRQEVASGLVSTPLTHPDARAERGTHSRQTDGCAA